jgi:hypothetical protein
MNDNTMKRIITFALAALFVVPAFSQHDGPKDLREKKEKVDAMKAAFITQEIDLTTEEAQRFWPVFNEMTKKIEVYRMEEAEKMMKMREEGKTVEDLTDEEVSNMMLARFSNEEAILKIKRSYHDKFIKLLGVKRTAKLYLAERDFQRQLMRKARNRYPQKREQQRSE